MKKLFYKWLTSKNILIAPIRYVIEMLACTMAPALLKVSLLFFACIAVLSYIIIGNGEGFASMSGVLLLLNVAIYSYLLNIQHSIAFHFYRKGISPLQRQWVLEATGNEFDTRLGLLRSSYLGLHPGFKLNMFNPYESKITDDKGNFTNAFKDNWLKRSGLTFATIGFFGGLGAIEGVREFVPSSFFSSLPEDALDRGPYYGIPLNTVDREPIQDDIFQEMLDNSSVFEDSSSFSDWYPSVNIDGTPMLGNSGIDAHGHSYGMTDMGSSIDNDWNSGGGGGVGNDF